MYDRTPYAPPVHVNIHERGILGLDWRKIIILAICLPVAIGLILVWQSGPFIMRGALGVFVALMGVALAFGQIEGKTPEAWLLNCFVYFRRQRFLQHRALRAVADNRQVKIAQAAKTAVEAKTKMAVSTSEWNFFVLTANAIGLSALTALTLWLAQGGAVDLIRTWHSLSSNSPL